MSNRMRRFVGRFRGDPLWRRFLVALGDRVVPLLLALVVDWLLYSRAREMSSQA